MPALTWGTGILVLVHECGRKALIESESLDNLSVTYTH